MPNPSPWKQPLLWMKILSVLLIGMIILNLWYQSKIRVQVTKIPDESIKTSTKADKNKDLIKEALLDPKTGSKSASTSATTKPLESHLTEINFNGLTPTKTAFPFFQKDSEKLKKQKPKAYLDEINLIAFWASWCPSCKKDFPFLQKIYEKWQTKGLQILSLNCDFKEDQTKALKKFKSYNLDFPVFFDVKNLFIKDLDIEVLPTYLLVKKSGEIIMQAQGTVDWESSQIQKKIQAHLKD